MPERTAAEVLAEKINELAGDLYNAPDSAKYGQFGSILHLNAVAARLAEDPAITVRTDMVVERFVVEIHRVPNAITLPPTAAQMHRILTDPESAYRNEPDHRIIVRPYPEEAK